MALWLLLLHASGLDRRLLHTHDQENAEKDGKYIKRLRQAGYWLTFLLLNAFRSLFFCLIFEVEHKFSITIICFPLKETGSRKNGLLPGDCVCALLVASLPEQDPEINHIWWERS